MKRLRPVGSTSRRPRDGAPAGPGATRRPSSAASSAARSASALASHCRIVRACGRAAVNVQAVFDGKVFQIAQPGIDAAKRVVRSVGGADAGFARQAGALRGFNDQLGQPLAAAAIEPFGLRVFVDQTLELARVAGEAAGHKRRRQMADGHAGDAALGLRGFARIADDERINDRERSGDDFRKTRRGERHRFAGQPFERAMRAHMHKRVNACDVL